MSPLTPAVSNSAYFEHTFRAADGHRAGRPGSVRHDDYAHMRTTSGPQRVDADTAGPGRRSSTHLAFRPDSEARRAGPSTLHVKGNIVIR